MPKESLTRSPKRRKERKKKHDCRCIICDNKVTGRSINYFQSNHSFVYYRDNAYDVSQNSVTLVCNSCEEEYNVKVGDIEVPFHIPPIQRKRYVRGTLRAGKQL